jgi:hypothetical protein
VPLNLNQIQSLLSEAVAAGLDPDEVEALRWVLVDQAAQLDGAMRLDAALALVDQPELDAAESFMGEIADMRKAAIKRGADDLLSMSDEEWQKLTGSDDEPA